MMKLSLSVAALIAVVAAMFAPSLIARAQAPVRFEYGRVSRYFIPQRQGTMMFQRTAYRACVAAANEWTCREFDSTESSDAAFRTALSTLGSEGWELVSVVNEDPGVTNGLTYLFKRPRQ